MRRLSRENLIVLGTLCRFLAEAERSRSQRERVGVWDDLSFEATWVYWWVVEVGNCLAWWLNTSKSMRQEREAGLCITGLAGLLGTVGFFAMERFLMLEFD